MAKKKPEPVNLQDYNLCKLNVKVGEQELTVYHSDPGDLIETKQVKCVECLHPAKGPAYRYDIKIVEIQKEDGSNLAPNGRIGRKIRRYLMERGGFGAYLCKYHDGSRMRRWGSSKQ